MKRFLLVVLILITLTGCSSTPTCSGADCTRVLFLGNSYTYVNDLPTVFAKLANAGKHKVHIGNDAQSGWSLVDHANSENTANLLSSTKWNYVILQEQSQIPAVQDARVVSMYPAARVLVQQIRDSGAKPIFFVTWAHRDGDPENGMPDFNTMQAQINQGYEAISRELQVPMAQVGNTWYTTRNKHPEISLWQDDGSHPTEAGTYLAACVFYAVIFHETPQGLTYYAGLPKETALALQDMASLVVLGH